MINFFLAKPSRWVAGLAIASFFSTDLLADDPKKDPANTIDFARDIRPLLSDRCFTCHGPDEDHREADLRVDQLDSLTEDRGDYVALSPGDAQASELYRRITSTDPSEAMPPPEIGKPLTDDEIASIKEWIDQGAVWKKHWAYELPVAHPTPNTDQRAENFIDAFIARRHQQAGRGFSPAADLITLARRLSFDLTGLPPAPEVITELETSTDNTHERGDEVERFIERLLASPAFGERFAVYWLDLVRYADTVGYHGDQDHNISPYRDYVINALNDALPINEFTVDQLAGDLRDAPTQEQIVATGYNRLLQTSHEGGVQPKEYLAIYAADRVRNVSATWMGATVGCAQCHDHKYDPYTAKDFYSLSTFFADIDEAQHFKIGSNALPTKRPPELEVLSRAQQLELEGLQSELAKLSGSLTQSEDACDEGDAEQSDETSVQIADLEARIEQLKSAGRKTMITVSIKPRVVRYLPRGNWLDDSGDVMQPQLPDFLASASIKDPANATRDSERALNRMDLARWLTNTDDGAGLLTARVFVNRVWMLLFGNGLSRSVEDFGGQGEAPSHPELLDRLTIEFVDSGWDLKHLVRLIVSSRAYRQSSLESAWHRENDPTNRWLTRQNRFRVTAEMVRDTSLACGDLLVRRIGGASAKPYQPAGYYRHLNFPTRKYSSSTGDDQWRRGLYVHWQRQFLHPMLRAFDAPTREECTAQRPQSNTPLSALVWLNDPSFLEAARGLAQRVLDNTRSSPTSTDKDSPPADIEAVKQLYLIATSRRPDEIETATLLELLQESRRYFSTNESEATALLSVGIMKRAIQEESSELAAWTMLARAVLNLSETYTRN